MARSILDGNEFEDCIVIGCVLPYGHSGTHQIPKRCSKCKCQLDATDCDDAEKSGTQNPNVCRGCEAWELDQAEYHQHLSAGGKPYEAWLLDNRGNLSRRIA